MNPSGKHTPVNDEAIEAMAASWLVQRDEGFSTEQAAEFARWQKADPRHAAAVAMLEETCGLLESMPLVREKLEIGAETVSGRSSEEATESSRGPRTAKIIRFPAVVKIAVAIAACFVATVVIWKTRTVQEAVTFANTYSTENGEYRRVPLPDGSIVELNANTELRVQFRDHRRDVALTGGEAHFTVAKNPARPFFVSAGNVGVRAVGTAFNVRHAPNAIDVLVTEGKVEVSNIAPGATLDAGAPVYLGAGQRAMVANDTTGRFAPTVTTVAATTMREALVWQNAPLIWLDAPLAEVVKQFNQRNRVQLAIDDADLAQRVVGGAIRADQVETFIRLLTESRDIAVERPDAEHIVVRKAR